MTFKGKENLAGSDEGEQRIEENNQIIFFWKLIPEKIISKTLSNKRELKSNKVIAMTIKKTGFTFCSCEQNLGLYETMITENTVKNDHSEKKLIV